MKILPPLTNKEHPLCNSPNPIPNRVLGTELWLYIVAGTVVVVVIIVVVVVLAVEVVMVVVGVVVVLITGACLLQTYLFFRLHPLRFHPSSCFSHSTQ